MKTMVVDSDRSLRRVSFVRFGWFVAFVLLIGVPANRVSAEYEFPPTAHPPEPREVEELLRREPISLETWPVWKQRLLAWIGSPSHRGDAAYKAVASYISGQAQADGQLPPPLDQDFFAWYLLGNSQTSALTPGNKEQQVRLIEQFYQKCIELEPKFARGHRKLALALLLKEPSYKSHPKVNAEIQRVVERAKEIDGTLKFSSIYGYAAMWHRDFAEAERQFAQAVADEPEDVDHAIGYCMAIIQNRSHVGKYAPPITAQAQRHPDDGTIACLQGMALAADGDPRAALKEFERARQLGTDPRKMFPEQVVQAIEVNAQPSPIELALWTAAGFVGVYAVVIGGMALAGVILGSWTRGAGVLQLLPSEPVELMSGGQVIRTESEPWVARLYGFCLVCGLILFYLALPFVVVGLLGSTLGLLWLIFQMGRVPIKLVVIVIVVGLGMVWAVLKSIFASMGTGSFGILKTEPDCPKLFEALQEVARRVDTTPVDQVYLAPGTEIGVHQEGRGPWGMFGTKRRVLTLGLATLRILTIPELKSILAHEYAHFSHQDTYYSRFIYRVDVSIHTALGGMGAAGGYFNYVNPFFWFLYLYYRSYSLLSAGFSRSREYLADRMACSLYGSNIFATSLTKVCTEGALFEQTMYPAVDSLLNEDKVFKNLYQSFTEYRQGDSSQEDREQIRKHLDEEQASFFASHPTFRERIAAAENFPRGTVTDERPAIELFENPEALEEELTEFLTGAMHYARQRAAVAAAAAAE